MTDEQRPRRGMPAGDAEQSAPAYDVPVYDYRPAHAGVPAPDPRRRTLRGSLLLTLASAVLPGSGLLGAPRLGYKILGGALTVLAVAALGFLGAKALTDQAGLAKAVASERTLTMLTPVLGAAALLWVALILLTHLVTRPRGLPDGRRLLSAVVVAALAFGVATPTAIAARYTRDAYLLLDNVLPDATEIVVSNRPTLKTEAPDPWEDTPRLNVLLLGADGSASRAVNVAKYGIRTDTVMVASIDTATGDTTLIQLPRNMQYVPFPEGSEMDEAFPRGFRGEPKDDFFLNSIWEQVEKNHPDLFVGSTYRGAEALKQGVEGVTGLGIDYFVMLNIDGLQNLIDAMGGVTVNINPVPDWPGLAIGGDTGKKIKPKDFLTPGPDQHLDGYHAMWYARSRYNTDDYDRMARQSCLVNAIIDQTNPQTLLTGFEPIAAASADMLTTDIPQQDLSAIIDLAFRVKDKGTVSRLAFVNGTNGYDWGDPDYEAIRALVAEAIAPRPAATEEPATSSASETPSTTPSATETEPDSPAENVADACGYTGE